MTYVTEAIKKELATIKASLMVQAVQLDHIPTDDGVALSYNVNQCVRERVGPIYNFLADQSNDGLEGSIKQASWQISTDKGYINRGGSKLNDDPSLNTGEWRYKPGGYELARKNIPNMDRLLKLASGLGMKPVDRIDALMEDLINSMM